MSIRESLARWGRRALIIPPILLGVAVLAVVVARRQGPAQLTVPEVARPLRVIAVPRTTLVPRVLGYGTARPGDVWTAVAEVKGRIVETNPELKSGAIIPEGAIVLRIDPAEYELQVSRIEAEIAQIKAQQEELDAQEANYHDSLEIEQQSLDVAEKDLARVRGLRASNAVSQTAEDQSLRSVLTQRQVVLELTSKLNVLPAQRKALEASLKAKQAGLGQAKLDLERTVLKAPFECRLGEVSLEMGQYLVAGQVLFEGHGVALAEIEAQVPIDRLRTLLPPREDEVDLSDNAMEVLRSIFDVTAIVRMRSGDFVVQWDGRFDRIREGLDVQTRTIQVVVAVDNPYKGVVPGKRPPLSPGMFCEVELRAAPRADQIVVPRICVRDDHVFLVDDENRLVRRPVKVAFSQGAISVVADGLAAGERLVVSDPTPAIEGMLIDPTLDEAIAKRLVAEAAGEGDIR